MPKIDLTLQISQIMVYVDLDWHWVCFGQTKYSSVLWTSFIFQFYISILIKLKSPLLKTKQVGCESNLRFDLHLVQLTVYLKNWESAWGALHNSFMLNLPSISIQLRALLQLQYVASMAVNTHLLILPGTAVLCSGYSVIYFFLSSAFCSIFIYFICCERINDAETAHT